MGKHSWAYQPRCSQSGSRSGSQEGSNWKEVTQQDWLQESEPKQDSKFRNVKVQSNGNLQAQTAVFLGCSLFGEPLLALSGSWGAEGFWGLQMGWMSKGGEKVEQYLLKNCCDHRVRDRQGTRVRRSSLKRNQTVLANWVTLPWEVKKQWFSFSLAHYCFIFF